MILDKISSGKINSNSGSSFSAVEINGDGLTIVNSQDERDSSGTQVLAGSETVLSSSRATGTTINANYIKSGVIDANLMRAGLIQTVPSWNTKWYGAPADHAAVQIGFTGGSIAATAVSTSTGTVSLTLPGGHGLITGDYVRVSGLYFTTGTLLGSVGLNLPTNGPVDYASATVSTNTLTYSKGDITSGLTASTASTVYVGKAFTVTAVTRSYDDPDNPAELSTVTVTTSAAHGFSAGDYIELAGIGETIDGVAYVTNAPTSTTFTFKQRFGNDIELDLSAADITLPTLGAPVAIKVLKSYTQNADGSIHITSGTVASTLIVGEIAATEITIGSGEGVVRVGSYPDAITPTFQGIWAGSATPSTAEFSVNTVGALVAASGTIGGFTLASDRLTNLGASKYAGIIDTALDTGLAFFAGATGTDGAGATFAVTNAGALSASTVSITGGSISIGGTFSVTSGGQVSGSGAYFDPATVGSAYRPAIVVAGNTTEGDIAAAGNGTTATGTLNLGVTKLGATGTGATGQFTNVMSLSAAYVNIGPTNTSTTGLSFKQNLGHIGPYSSSSSNSSIGIYTSSSRSAFGNLVAENFFPGGQGSKSLGYDGVNFTFNDGIEVSGSVDGTTFYSSSGTYAVVGSSGGDVFLTGGDTSVPISGNGEVTAIPNTTTATTNSARWVLLSGSTYGLRRDSSTRRVKTNIVQADEEVLAAAKRLRAVHFEPLEKDEEGNLRGTGQLTLGLIAEEILEAGLGCAVTYDSEGLPDGYDERVLLAAMIHHISDLEDRLAELEGNA